MLLRSLSCLHELEERKGIGLSCTVRAPIHLPIIPFCPLGVLHVGDGNEDIPALLGYLST